MTQKTETNEQGQRRESKLVRPYLIDLGSTNGCYVIGDRIEAQRCAATSARVRACVRACVRVHVCVPACVTLRARVRVRACVCACVHVCMPMCVCAHACFYACIYLSMCTCACRYVELLEKDCLRFGYSSREYVLLNADKGTSEI